MLWFYLIPYIYFTNNTQKKVLADGEKRMDLTSYQFLIQEIQLLESIKQSNKEKNWKMISKLLAKKGFRRTEQQCRHKWVNCLSPEINHGPWSDEELATLYLQYERNLSRWSVIQKFLPNRTQIKIKNHFYGVLRNIVRFVLKHFHKVPGKQTEISNKVNPNSLKSLFWGEGDYQFLQNEIKNVISSMKYRFSKQKLSKIISQKEKVYKKLNQKILEEVNIHLKLIMSTQHKQRSSNQGEVEGCSQGSNQSLPISVVPKIQEKVEEEPEAHQAWNPYMYWPSMYQFPVWQIDNTLNMPYMVYMTGNQLNNYNKETFDISL